MTARVRTLMWKEFLELRQTPRLLFLLIVAPIIQLTLLGYAATTDIKHVPIVVVDGDRTPRSRQLIERFSASPYFQIVGERMSPRDVDADLAGGRAWLAIVIPLGLDAAVTGHGPDERPGNPSAGRRHGRQFIGSRDCLCGVAGRGVQRGGRR